MNLRKYTMIRENLQNLPENTQTTLTEQPINCFNDHSKLMRQKIVLFENNNTLCLIISPGLNVTQLIIVSNIVRCTSKAIIIDYNCKSAFDTIDKFILSIANILSSFADSSSDKMLVSCNYLNKQRLTSEIIRTNKNRIDILVFKQDFTDAVQEGMAQTI